MTYKAHSSASHWSCRTKDHMLTPCHALFAYLNPLLIGILQVHCQATNKSPFETHSANLWAFLLATLVYCFTLTANTKPQHCKTNFTEPFNNVALISGSFSSVSLVAVFLPRYHGMILAVFIFWGAFALLVARDFLRFACMWVSGRLSMVGSQCTRVKHVLTTRKSINRSPLPV